VIKVGFNFLVAITDTVLLTYVVIDLYKENHLWS
jgi:hypothetical protein